LKTLVLELLFNAALLIFFAYSYYYIGVTMPDSASTELGPEQWPKLILGALIVLIIINIIKIYKSTPAKDRNTNEIKNIELKAILRSKLFIGIALVLIYALSLEAAGFILSTCIFLMIYGRLIGEKRIKILVSSGIGITFGAYIVFAKGLSIMLPRGYGILRSFALFLETL